VTKKLQELAQSTNSADLGNDFPPPESGIYSSKVHTSVLACLQADANSRPSSTEVAIIFEQIVKASVEVSEIVLAMQIASVKAAAQASPTHKSSLAAPTVVAPPSISHNREFLSVPTACEQTCPTTPTRSRRSFSKLDVASCSDYGSSVTGSSCCGSTPPTSTRCPSSSESVGSASVCSFLGRAIPCSFDLEEDDSSATGMSHQRKTCEDIQALCASPEKPQAKDSLQNIQAFLSSPEALCGLSQERHLFLRQKLATAQVLEEANFQPLPRGRLMYSDTLPRGMVSHCF
jgi:hypothetical protein